MSDHMSSTHFVVEYGSVNSVIYIIYMQEYISSSKLIHITGISLFLPYTKMYFCFCIT